MTNFLDRWQERKTSKKKKSAKMEMEELTEVSVETLGKGTAALVPKEGTMDVWNVSSEEESEPEEVQHSYEPAKKGIGFGLFLTSY